MDYYVKKVSILELDQSIFCPAENQIKFPFSTPIDGKFDGRVRFFQQLNLRVYTPQTTKDFQKETSGNVSVTENTRIIPAIHKVGNNPVSVTDNILL